MNIMQPYPQENHAEFLLSHIENLLMKKTENNVWSWLTVSTIHQTFYQKVLEKIFQGLKALLGLLHNYILLYPLVK